MAKTAFRCSRCGRGFSMKAHLVRHMNSAHGAGGRKKTAKKRRGPGRPKGSKNKPKPATTYAAMAPAGMENGSSAIVDQMQQFRDNLLSQRSQLDAGIDALTRAINEMGGSAAAMGGAATGLRKRGRPKGSGGRAGSLKDYIVRVLGQTGQPLSPREIGSRVKKAGYPTKAQDLTKAVSNTLPDMKAVKKVGFGQYVLA